MAKIKVSGIKRGSGVDRVHIEFTTGKIGSQIVHMTITDREAEMLADALRNVLNGYLSSTVETTDAIALALTWPRRKGGQS